MSKEHVFIAVKTYPILSESHIELACTAGFRKDGSWIRLYPIPFRLLKNDKRYKKYQWIKADIAKNIKDPRPESFNIINRDAIELMEEVSLKRNWAERKRLIFRKNTIHTDLNTLISRAHKNELSLAIFKPASIEDFKIAKAPKDQHEKKLKKVLDKLKQTHLFEKEQDIAEFKTMPKLPYKFS